LCFLGTASGRALARTQVHHGRELAVAHSLLSRKKRLMSFTVSLKLRSSPSLVRSRTLVGVSSNVHAAAKRLLLLLLRIQQLALLVIIEHSS